MTKPCMDGLPKDVLDAAARIEIAQESEDGFHLDPQTGRDVFFVLTGLIGYVEMQINKCGVAGGQTTPE